MTGQLARLALISGTLFAFWLLLSGNYKTWLVVSGAVSAVAVVAFSLRKGVTDEEGFPVELLPRALPYWAWLIGEILRSGVAVARLVLSREMRISPTIVEVRAAERTPVGLVTYANSITLTPGTLSIEVSEHEKTVWVHAITAENAAGFADDPMNRRVAEMEGAG